MIYKNYDSSLEIVSEKDVHAVYIFDSVLKICPPLHLEIFGHAKQGEYFSALIGLSEASWNMVQISVNIVYERI